MSRGFPSDRAYAGARGAYPGSRVHILPPDLVAVHTHDPDDIQGLQLLFPPTQITDGTTLNPAAPAAWGLMAEMQITVLPPLGISPVWECRLIFDGTFTGDGLLGFRLSEKPSGGGAVPLPEATRAVRVSPGDFTNGSVSAVVQVPEVGAIFQVEWQAPAAVVTSYLDQRHLIAVLQPYAPAAV